MESDPLSKSDYVELVTEIHDEAVNNGNYELLYEYLAEENSLMGDSEVSLSPAAMENFFRRLRSAFPDLTETIEDVWVDGNVSVFRFTRSGTFENELLLRIDAETELTFEPTGEQFSYSGVVIDVWEDGQIVKGAGYADELGLFTQLGIIPDLSEFAS